MTKHPQVTYPEGVEPPTLQGIKDAHARIQYVALSRTPTNLVLTQMSSQDASPSNPTAHLNNLEYDRNTGDPGD